MSTRRGRLLLALSFLGTGAAASAEETVVVLDPPVLGVAALRAGPGEPPFLLVARPTGIERIDRSAPATPAARLPRGSRRIFSWCVAADKNGAERVHVLADGGQVLAWDGRAPEAEVLLEKSGAVLPAGVYHMQFARDLNGDGRLDLVAPTTEGLSLFFGTETGLRPGPLVRHRVAVDLGADGPGAAGPRPTATARNSRRLIQTILIPQFLAADQNGDGFIDLAFSDEDLVQFFWSDRSGALPEAPTFSLDLEEIRSLLPQPSLDTIDPANLLGVLESLVSHVTRDLDGDGCADLLLRRGRKVSLYRGGPAGIDRSEAAQVLKTGGNLLAAFAGDENGDGRDDLFLLTVSDVSLGQLLYWLVAGGDLTLDLFVYTQQSPLRFTRKPARRRTLRVSLPSVRSLVSSMDDLAADMNRRFTCVPVVGDFDGDGHADDAARLANRRRIEIFPDTGEPEPTEWRDLAWRNVIRQFDREARGQDELEIGLVDMVEWFPFPRLDLVRLLATREPGRVISLSSTGAPEDPDTAQQPVLIVLDLDGDGADDLVLAEGDGTKQPLRLTLVTVDGGRGAK